MFPVAARVRAGRAGVTGGCRPSASLATQHVLPAFVSARVNSGSGACSSRRPLSDLSICRLGRVGWAQPRMVSVCFAATLEEAPQESDEETTQKVLAQCTRRIKDLGERGRMKDAIQTLAGLSRLGVQPDTVAATALVKACCKDMEMAQSVFDELFTDFLQPDEVVFAVLLRGYGAKSPPDWVRMDTVLSTMRLKFSLSPTATSYNALLDVCCKTNDLERGEDVIDRMHRDRVEADEYTEETVAGRKSLRSYLKKRLGPF